MKKIILASFLILSFIGFLDATYLTFEHYNKGLAPCYIFGGCEKVLTSNYATIAGFPISLGGAVYYLAIFIFSISYIDTGKKLALVVLTKLPTMGFLASLYLLYLQLFVIKSICFYCMISLVTSTGLFFLSLLLLKFNKSNLIGSNLSNSINDQ